MKCCVSTDVGTWTNWLTFEPDPDYSVDAGTGLLSPLSYKLNYAEFYVGENPRYTYWHGPTLQRCVVLEWFHSVSRRNNFAGGTCAPLSAFLVIFVLIDVIDCVKILMINNFHWWSRGTFIDISKNNTVLLDLVFVLKDYIRTRSKSSWWACLLVRSEWCSTLYAISSANLK